MSTASSKKGPVRKWASRIVLLAVALLVVAAIVSAAIPKAATVRTAAVEKGHLAVTVDEDGRTRVKERHVISAPLAGTLARIDLQAGDPIEAKTIVASLLPLPAPLLDPRTKAQSRARLAAAEASYHQAQAAEAGTKAALEYAEAEIKRTQPLAERGSIPKQQFDRLQLDARTQREAMASASFGVRVARHEVQLSRAALGRISAKDSNEQMTLGSPVDGVVLEVLRESEGVVQAGTPLIEVGNPAALEIVVDVLTTDAVRVKPGAQAKVLRWGGAGELDAHVARVEPKAFTRMSSLGVEEQRVNVVLELDAPRSEWLALGDGYRVEASITVWEDAAALHIPVGAVFRRNSVWTVFVIEGDAAKLRTVEIGERNGFDAQVLSGLAEGDPVILHPGEQITDGTKVQKAE